MTKTQIDKQSNKHDLLRLGEISHDICNHDILWFWLNISWNLKPWYIVISHEICNHEILMFWWIHLAKICSHEIFWYLMNSATMRYRCSGVISHKICNHEIFYDHDLVLVLVLVFVLVLMLVVLLLLVLEFLDALASLERVFRSVSQSVSHNFFVRYCHQGMRSNRPSDNRTKGQ